MSWKTKKTKQVKFGSIDFDVDFKFNGRVFTRMSVEGRPSKYGRERQSNRLLQFYPDTIVDIIDE